jgi:aryl sulfotransferase
MNKKIYQNFILDSSRWSLIEDRPGDIIVVSPYKSGTTWMQNIVLQLIFQDFTHKEINKYSHWVENRITQKNILINKLESQTHRRCLKTHLPVDGIGMRANSKFLVLGRDPRDVFISLWNHYKNYSDNFYNDVNNKDGLVGPPLEKCPETIEEFWNLWLTKGAFPWQSEGYPHWSYFENIQQWWELRNQDNVLLVHYDDLKENLEKEIKKISSFLNIECNDIDKIASLVSFNTMKENSDILIPNSKNTFTGGPTSFFNKGISGQWTEQLSNNDLVLYEQVSNNLLSKECKTWLEKKIEVKNESKLL